MKQMALHRALTELLKVFSHFNSKSHFTEFKQHTQRKFFCVVFKTMHEILNIFTFLFCLDTQNCRKSMQTVNFNTKIDSLINLNLGTRLVGSPKCVCACVWLYIRVTVGGWVVIHSLLWSVCVAARYPRWDGFEGSLRNMSFNPWVYCHFKEQITFYVLAAGASF